MSKNSATSKTPSTSVDAANSDQLQIILKEGDDADLAAARIVAGPCVSNAIAFAKATSGTHGKLHLMKLVEAMTESANKVKANDMSDVEAMLMSQAMALNGMFADLTNRSVMNRSGGYFDASQAYLKMAFKAQNQCRMTLETLSTIKNPPVVYAKQANIAHGPQQVNNGGVPSTRTNEIESSPSKLLESSNEQPLDTGAAGKAVRRDSALATVGGVDGTKNG